MKKQTSLKRWEILCELQLIEYWIDNKPWEHRHDWNDFLQATLEQYVKRHEELEILYQYVDKNTPPDPEPKPLPESTIEFLRTIDGSGIV